MATEVTTSPPARRAAATREQLISATERLMCEGGLSAVTTQSVARTCGLSEGTIYRHFASREELIVTTLRERLPGEFKAHIDEMRASAGTTPLDAQMQGFLASIAPIFENIAPTLGMLAADPGLAARNAESMCADGKGPRLLLSDVAGYLESEQRLGRVRADVNTRAVAALLVGVCFYRGLMQHLFREDPTDLSDADLAKAVADVVAHGIAAPPA